MFKLFEKHLIPPPAIALPTQAIVHDAERGVPTTKRKLTLDDLTSQLKHYSAGVRKGLDATTLPTTIILK